MPKPRLRSPFDALAAQPRAAPFQLKDVAWSQGPDADADAADLDNSSEPNVA